MKYLVFLLGVLVVSCNTNSTQVEEAKPIITETTITEPVDSIIIEESIEQLIGFPRFFFVKDSLGFELENVKILADTYSKEKANFNQLEKDTAYFIMLNFLKEIRIAPEDDKALYEYNEIKESEIAKYYKRFGISIESAEGEYYCVPNYSYLAQLFKGDLSPDLEIYKEFLVVSNRHIFDDGGLIISWMQLATQIIEIEDYYFELKHSKYGEEVFQDYLGVAHPLMFGTENSFIMDSSDSIEALLPEVQAAYDMLILDPIHHSGDVFSVHLNNLEKAYFNAFAEEAYYLTNEEIKKLLNSN